LKLKTLLCLQMLLAFTCLSSFAGPARAGNYKNFEVSVYVIASDVQKMKDPAWLEARWAKVTDGLRVDKVYLETYREELTPDQEAVDAAKKFFKGKGVKTAGGIATVVKGWPWFVSFCYTDAKDRQRLKSVVEFTARNFDEIIMDDFFFNNTKLASDIRAKEKANKSWSRFRLDLMADVSKNVVVGPAKKVNPKVKVVIKYPNWYEHFPNSGYNLEAEPRIFDGIYTGTETRDGPNTDQHLQPYLGYNLMLYLENIKPGGNGGGWVDPYNWRDKERYGEQLWLTLFAKAREIALFQLSDLIKPMQATPHSPVKGNLSSYAGGIFAAVDGFVGKLGKPTGVKVYKPFHSNGEDFLTDFIGMIGIPTEMTPRFPDDASTVLLTESAGFDPLLVGKIKKQLERGKKVVITSGLLKALQGKGQSKGQGKGIEEIVELERTGEKALVRDFNITRGPTFRAATDILIPQVRYPTNDTWEIVTARVEGVGYPILLKAPYAKSDLYVLTIPDNFADLYNLPPEILDQIRAVIAGDLPVRLEGPGQIGLFVYDNDKFIVESFAPPGARPVAARVALDKKFKELVDLVSGKRIAGSVKDGKAFFDLTLAPSSYQALAAQ
jgi:hypothetical protein